MQASSIINFTSSASLLSGEWGWAENPKLLIKPGLSGDQRPSRPSQSPLIRTKDTLGALITEEFTKVSGAYIRTRDVPGALITQEMTRVAAALCQEWGRAETYMYIFFLLFHINMVWSNPIFFLSLSFLIYEVGIIYHDIYMYIYIT